MHRRHSTRCRNRSTVRRVTCSTVRVRWRGPDLLGQALTAYRRAIIAYRRLARLAPRHFDTTVVQRERRAREEQRRWVASWEPALEKAYGPPTPAEREAQRLAEWRANQPPELSPGMVRRVEAELAERRLWLETGRQAFAHYQQRYPHAVPSLGRIASLVDIGVTFGRIATGMEDSAGTSESPAPEHPDWQAQIYRAYGDALRSETVAAVSAAGVPPPVVTPSAPAPATFTPVQTVPPPGAVPEVPAPPRCDAWSRLARQLRRSAMT